MEFLLEILPEGFQFDVLYIGLIAFVQRGNVFDHLVDARNIFFHHVGQFGDLRLLVFVAFAQQIAGMADGGQRVADFVRQIGCEHAQCRQFQCLRFTFPFGLVSDKEHEQFGFFLHQRNGADIYLRFVHRNIMAAGGCWTQ